MKIRLSFFLLSSLCLLGLGWWSESGAQTSTAGVVAEAPKPLSIDEKITAESNALEALQALPSAGSGLPAIGELLQHLTINADNLTAKIQSLPTESVSAEHLSAAKRSTDDLKQAVTLHQEYLADLNNGLKQIETSKEQLTALQQLVSNPLNQDKVSPQKQQQLTKLLAQAESLQQAFTTGIAQEQNSIEQAAKAIAVLNRWQAHLTQSLEKTTPQPKKTAGNQEVINGQKKTYEDNIIRLSTQLQNQRKQLSLADIEKLQKQIYEQQNQLWLLSVDNDLLHWLEGLPVLIPSLSVIADDSINSRQQLEEQLANAQLVAARLEDKLQELKIRQTDFENYTKVVGELPPLASAFASRLKMLSFQQLQVEKLQNQLVQRLSQQSQATLLAHDHFFRNDNLSKVFSQLAPDFVQMLFQVKISFTGLYKQFAVNPWQIVAGAAIAVFLALLTVRIMNYLITRTALRKGVEIGLISTLRKFFHAIRRQAYIFTLLAFVIALVHFSDTPPPGDKIISCLAYTLAGLILWLEMTAIEVRLGSIKKTTARSSNIAAVILAVLVLLYQLSSLSAVSAPVVAIYEKVLILGIIVFTWVVQKNLVRYLQGEQEHLTGKAYHVYNVVIKILPKAIVVVCVLGLIGFVNLTWMVLSYTGIVLAYTSVMTLGIILLNMLRKQSKLLSLKRFKHGAFIAQDIINPLSTLSKIIWVLGCSGLLFAMIAWYSNSTFLPIRILQWLQTPLFSFGNNNINMLSLMLLVASPFVLLHIARWLRNFSYHWLFARVKDLGVRNSLSIFSQYVAALIGVLITLKIVGINLTSLAVFAGALGVGVGLGLQDIAKNFISGILLLIERPLRSGDWVAIDGSEGTVKSIGMRAVTVVTFDNQEVIIPNGNAISNSFTNYTHSNSLIRTVLYVGAGYSCDPERVMGILQKILADTKGVLKDPKPKVVMWEYADSCINYRIQYYIDMDNSGILDTRTTILKQIWYDFEANGIEIPFPQRDINFRHISAAADITATDEHSDKAVLATPEDEA